MDFLNFIQEIYTENTGGGIDCDVLVLRDGTVLVISEEAVVMYENLEAWEDNAAQQIGTILRPLESRDSA